MSRAISGCFAMSTRFEPNAATESGWLVGSGDDRLAGGNIDTIALTQFGAQWRCRQAYLLDGSGGVWLP